jgi:DNA-directed RNA polymerase specialized sigma24 family protein
MSSPEQNKDRAWFTTTHWSVVLSAGRGQGSEALEILCRTYWYPVYAYIRRKGLPIDDAKDATQAFFVTLLERQSLQSASPDKGRFRSYLMSAVNYFLADVHAKAMTQRRGEGRLAVELDAIEAEERYRLEPAVPPAPERLYDRRWALMILDRALQRLAAEYGRTQRGAVFGAIQGFLTTDPPSVSYARIATSLEMQEGALKTAIHRLRRRYREVCREEVGQTVADPAEIDAELRYLCEVLSDVGIESVER